MDWIKKNYDRFTLALFAAVLFGASVLLFLNTQGFATKFSEAQSNPSKGRKLPDVSTTRIDAAVKDFNEPTKWQQPPTLHGGLVFTSERYYPLDGKLSKPTGPDGLYKHSYTGDEIPNDWFLASDLPLLEPSVPFQDPDGDGFVNEDEWLQKTNPINKDSKPPLYTQLFLAKWEKVPFRLKFQAYDGDPKRDDVKKMEFQINTLDLRQPTEFLKIGSTVANTKFKLVGFQYKEAKNQGTGEMEDVSELTMKNEDTGEEVILVLNKVADSPNQFAQFEYRWNKKRGEAGQLIRVQKLKEFVLQPQIDQKHKLLDVTEAQAVIQRPDGEKHTVPPVKK